ncbi:MAG TPA: hypothetical protein VFW65_36545 [Pseudonocardiaceae bacterium]|nr:hypothetical protein [Pseudonocardiaceae bacterium]
MRRVSSMLAAGAVVTATGLLTAACLQGGASATGAGTSGSASASSSVASTTASAPESAPTTVNPADKAAVAGAFAKTTATGTAHVATSTRVSLGQQGVPITATGSIRFADRAADLVEMVPGTQGNGETRFVDGTLYARLPGSLLAGLSHGRKWISVDLTALSQHGDGSFQQLLTDSPSDPTAMLGFLRGAGGTVTKVGQDTIDGVPTTHYTVELNLDRAAQGQSEGTQRSIHVLEQQLGSHTLPAQVWIDNQGLVRRIMLHENLKGTADSARSGNVTVDVTATLSDFGAPVTITAPPADQTADLTQALSGGQH